MELPRTGTKIDPLTLPNLLRKAWPELNATGARLITAQYMGETTGGKSCWNYNLGNVKCTKEKRNSHLHQYLLGTWEYWSASVAANAVNNNTNARYATATEIAKKVGHESGGRRVVFFKPPDIECCFLAYKSLGDGVIEWTDHYKRMASRNPGLLDQLNKGDSAAFAKALHKAGYFSQDESDYASSMKQQLDYLNGALK